MVELYRLFKVESRTLTNQQHKFAGQVGDSISTNIHFTYEPEGILEEGGYTPYIMFNIMDCKGRPIVYSPHSPHKFDGYDFSIPWEVTSQIKNNRLEYQLLLVRSDVQFDGNIVSLGDTEYLLSNMDGIAYKHSVKVSRCGCGGLNPGMEPSEFGWLNFWKEYGLIKPVDYERKAGGDGGRLVFRTVNKEPFYVEIPDARGDKANDGKTVFNLNGKEVGYTTANQNENKQIDIDVPASNDGRTTFKVDNKEIGYTTANQDKDKEINIPIPKVNNAKITFVQNGKVIGTITLNQEGDQTIEIGGGGEPTHEAIVQSVSVFGSAMSKEYIIPHNLNTMDLSAKIRHTNPSNEGYGFIEARTYAVDNSHIRVVFNKAPTVANEYTMILTTSKTQNGISNIIFGNTTDKEYVLTHGMNTMDLTFTIRRRTASGKGYEFVKANINAIDNNRVKVKLSHPATNDNEFVLIAISNLSSNMATSKTFGNLTDKDYIVAHNLNTLDIDYSIRKTNPSDDGFPYVSAKVMAIDNNSVKIHLSRPPTQLNEFTFMAITKD